MKKFHVFILIVLFLCGCSRMSEGYPFENKEEAIKSIELLYYPWYLDESKPFMEFETVRILNQEEIPAFMERVYALDTRKSAPTPPGNYGMYIARINYENGDTEYLGSTHIEFVKSGETAYAVGYYYFTGDDFENLFWNTLGDGSNKKTGDGSGTRGRFCCFRWFFANFCLSFGSLVGEAFRLPQNYFVLWER